MIIRSCALGGVYEVLCNFGQDVFVTGHAIEVWIVEVYMLLFGNTVNKRRLGCHQKDDSQQEETSRGIV